MRQQTNITKEKQTPKENKRTAGEKRLQHPWNKGVFLSHGFLILILRSSFHHIVILLEKTPKWELKHGY